MQKTLTSAAPKTHKHQLTTDIDDTRVPLPA